MLFRFFLLSLSYGVGGAGSDALMSMKAIQGTWLSGRVATNGRGSEALPARIVDLIVSVDTQTSKLVMNWHIVDQNNIGSWDQSFVTSISSKSLISLDGVAFPVEICMLNFSRMLQPIYSSKDRAQEWQSFILNCTACCLNATLSILTSDVFARTL
ncbi:hypothetical protein GUITHDRAFT_99633 [Guillardia theta CCMP2712]|uniref:Uncharacterized protein n=1 Tax=Guillardia theta (strain CCMP2712) TaxID=905079 RepID=L1K324_GUITC|nr:hypothetical protein GUITHDRAFT_99633 [Guillardia theta CCMP2712]EKX54987.1 hypothetical protein GUITHDRAFT_99633 [Guillardia theta CCMP2712]|eukprot:XP_005841967.1 hypothetical protein GUITHDRAFT_99633 [Guillardia theta CCMP2712]